jgi:hypothetical protein
VNGQIAPYREMRRGSALNARAAERERRDLIDIEEVR